MWCSVGQCSAHPCISSRLAWGPRFASTLRPTSPPQLRATGDAMAAKFNISSGGSQPTRSASEKEPETQHTVVSRVLDSGNAVAEIATLDTATDPPAAMGARRNFEVLSEKDARKAIYQQLQIASEESFEEKQLKQELAKKRMERLYAQIMLQRIASKMSADVASQSRPVANKDRGSEGSGGVALVQPTLPDTIRVAMDDAETLAMGALKVLASECTARIYESIFREVSSALGLLAKIDRSSTASADALLAMGRAVAACPPEQSREMETRVLGVENNVRDVAVWRCQMNARPMDSRMEFEHSLRFAFGEVLDNPDKILFARLMHAHRTVVAVIVPIPWKSNSQRDSIKKNRKRPKRERHTHEAKEEDVEGAEKAVVDEGAKEDLAEPEKEDVDKDEDENSDSLRSESLELESV